jgi:N-acetylglucosaminyldiphosphoundecaprenol N-acetyl-beta-D-mannosaminyltransferase
MILGVRFFTGSLESAVELGMIGGLIVVPSAPVLVEMERSPSHREALRNADLAIADSGLMVLVWWLLTGERMKRISGPKYLSFLLSRPETEDPAKTVWIMPSKTSCAKNISWLRGKGHLTSEKDCYIAPTYSPGNLKDPELLEFILSRTPSQIIVALGGGTQERLGNFLKESLNYRPGIHCVGAAIGFLSGDQVRIPKWADGMYLGWLVRCLSNPQRFVPRYLRAVGLIGLLYRNRGSLPPLTEGAH